MPSKVTKSKQIHKFINPLLDDVLFLFNLPGVCRGETDPGGGATITGTHICCGPDGLPYLPEGAAMPHLPPGVPLPGQPLPPGGTHPDQIPPGMPHPGVFPGEIPYPGGIPIPQQDETTGLTISHGQGGFEEATGVGGVYPYGPQGKITE